MPTARDPPPEERLKTLEPLSDDQDPSPGIIAFGCHRREWAAAKRLRRSSPLNGERRSLRKISEELAVLGFLNERGKPYNPRSIKAMLE